MKINLENFYLVPSINFLQALKLKGAQSRSRSKLVKLLTQSLTTLQEDERKLVEEYGHLDENGEVVKNDQGEVDIQPDRKAEWQQEHRKLLNEVAEIEGGTYVNHIDDCRQILLDYDGEMSGQDAEAYDALLDAFEQSEEKENNNVKDN